MKILLDIALFDMPNLNRFNILSVWIYRNNDFLRPLKTVLAVQPGCVLSRSSLVPSCATHSGSPRLPMARTLHLWPIWGLFQPLWPPGTAIPGPKIGSSSSAWMCAIPFQPCSNLCHPSRVATAAYGQNTAFMAIFGTFWP